MTDKQDIDGAIDTLLAHFDDLLSAGEFAHCDAALSALDCAALPPTLLLVALSATKRAAPHLPGRPAFVRRVAGRLKKTDPERRRTSLKGAP